MKTRVCLKYFVNDCRFYLMDFIYVVGHVPPSEKRIQWNFYIHRNLYIQILFYIRDIFLFRDISIFTDSFIFKESFIFRDIFMFREFSMFGYFFIFRRFFTLRIFVFRQESFVLKELFHKNIFRARKNLLHKSNDKAIICSKLVQ